MKKENKLILSAMKAALKVAEAAERIRVKNDSKYGTSSAMRPGGTHSPKTDTTAETPTGKIMFQQSEKPRILIERMLYSQDEEIKRFEEENTELRKLLVDARDREDALRLGRARNLGRWKPEDMPQPDSPSTEKTIEDFAGDDRSQVYSLIEKHLGINRTDSVLGNGRAFVHLKSPELGTETLVVLSPEGETLLKIVKDNSRKFEVR